MSGIDEAPLAQAGGSTRAVDSGLVRDAEISTGTRRVIEFFLDPIRKTTSEGLRER